MEIHAEKDCLCQIWLRAGVVAYLHWRVLQIQSFHLRLKYLGYVLGEKVAF